MDDDDSCHDQCHRVGRGERRILPPGLDIGDRRVDEGSEQSRHEQAGAGGEGVGQEDGGDDVLALGEQPADEPDDAPWLRDGQALARAQLVGHELVRPPLTELVAQPERSHAVLR